MRGLPGIPSDAEALGAAQVRRAASGGHVDRSKLLFFEFDGRHYGGYAGDTLASALLANGVRVFGRSFKYHRPRGVLGAYGEEPNALVTVGTGARAEPNLRATQVELYDGLVAASQNRWPSLRLDAGSVNDLAARLLPAGFYYKTFMWPASAWMGYERVIRRAAGLGRAPSEPDPDRYVRRHAHCDVLVVGAGPAGLVAAQCAAESGARVMLVDERPQPGGSLFDGGSVLDGQDGARWADAQATALGGRGNVRILTRATAFGYYDQNLVAVLERLNDHAGPPGAGQPHQRLWWVRARQVVLASGEIERPLVFSGNDRPGVMLASAARTYAHRYAVRCGDRPVLFTNNDRAYDTLGALGVAGAQTALVVDARPGGPGPGARAAVEASGCEMLCGHAVVRTHGRHALTAIEVAPLGGEKLAAARRRVECDLLCVSGGFNPTVHLYSQSQGSIVFDAALAAFVPGEPRQAVRAAGACNGTQALGPLLEEAALAGAGAAAAAGFGAPAPGPLPAIAEVPAEAPPEPLWRVPKPARGAPKRFVDFQNDVTAEDVALAVRENYAHVEHLKRYTTLGMGTDQGRTSNVNGLALLGELTGREIPDVGVTTFRPPFAPVTVGALAGPEVGRDLAPVRRTPLHEWHLAAGAPMMNAGLWLRPQAYPRPGETLRAAYEREALHVRRAVGIVDVSTLGKIEVQGPHAGAFLNRIYSNRFDTLKVGRCRYGLMLREDGLVADDGTATRVSEHCYYVTTTTGHAAQTLAHMEFYAQTVWPQMRVRMVSVTDQWAGIALAGPRSRDVLERVVDGGGVGAQALAYLGYQSRTIDGVPVRVFRVTFSGELGYEIHVPANNGATVWERLLELGAPFGIAPYGVEAMSILRIEKGHVVHAEIDGRVTAADVGLGALCRADAPDFVGQRSLERPALNEASRKRLVGLTSVGGRPIPRGAQLVRDAHGQAPVEMLGHVSSVCYSPNLGRHIALALVAGGRDAFDGQELVAASPLTGEFVAVRVGPTAFIDPEGVRARG